MKAPLFDKNGKNTGEMKLPDQLFSDNFRPELVAEVVQAELNNRRQGSHKTKSIYEIRGGGRKPWRQKGTGHARQGSIRAAQFRGGATIFGPKPRDYTVRISPKKRRAAVRAIFSRKAVESSLSIIKDIEMSQYSTGMIFKIIKKTGLELPRTKVAFVVGKADEKLKKSISNIASLHFIYSERIVLPELHFADHVLIAESALNMLVERYKEINKQKTESAA